MGCSALLRCCLGFYLHSFRRFVRVDVTPLDRFGVIDLAIDGRHDPHAHKRCPTGARLAPTVAHALSREIILGHETTAEAQPSGRIPVRTDGSRAISPVTHNTQIKQQQ